MEKNVERKDQTIRTIDEQTNSIDKTNKIHEKYTVILIVWYGVINVPMSICRIEQGYYSTNEKIPTENELVKLSGLSRATVRQALRNLENDGYIIRKKRVGSFVQRMEIVILVCLS